MNRAMTSLASSYLATSMPPIGLGTYMLSNIPHSIHSAIEAGYRRIDCAPVYFNEDVIGDALASIVNNNNNNNTNTVGRDDLFIVSKLAGPFHRQEHVELAVRKTLNDLRLDYLDLFLIHWPVAFHYVPLSENDWNRRGWKDESIDDSDGGNNIDNGVSVAETWAAMELLVEKGLVRSIGVSNFPVSLLHELLANPELKHKPAVNQVELHPYLQQERLLKYCVSRGVHVQAYSPLGTPGYKEKDEPAVLENSVLKDIAESRNISVAQLCIVWALQRGTSVNVKSSSPERMRENISLMTSKTTSDGNNNNPMMIRLTEDEMKRIAELDRGYRYFRPEDWWGGMAVFH